MKLRESVATQDSMKSRISSSRFIMFRPSSACQAALSSERRMLLRTLNRLEDISARNIFQSRIIFLIGPLREIE